MPLTPDAPNYVPQLTAALQASPSYVPPDMDEITNPAKQVALSGAIQQQDQSAQDLSMRQQAFQLTQQQRQQNLDLNKLLNPMLTASQDAKQNFFTASVARQTADAQDAASAFSELPDYSARLSAVDPTSDNFEMQTQAIVGQASQKPALYAALLKTALPAAQAKRQAFLHSIGGQALAAAQSAVAKNPALLPIYEQTKQAVADYVNSPDPDPTRLLGNVGTLNTSLATAARASFQSQNAALGPDYAVALPTNPADYLDPDKNASIQKEIATAAQQKAEGARLQQLYTTKNQGALDVQDLKNQGRMDYVQARFGSSPLGQSADGKTLVAAANAINLQLKNPNVAADMKVRLQGQLEGINAEMATKIGVPMTAPSGASATSDPVTDNVLKSYDKGIEYIKEQILKGNADLPKSGGKDASIDGGLTDPVVRGVLYGTKNVPDGMTPNEFRLKQFQQARASVAAQGAAATGSPSASATIPANGGATSSPAPTPQPTMLVNPAGGAPFAAPADSLFSRWANPPPTSASSSATPETDAALQASGAAANATPNPPTVTPNATQLETQFQKALAWAKANPRDPKASRILQLIQSKSGM